MNKSNAHSNRMYWNQSESQQDFVREIQELEDSYAEALADGLDARSLSSIWQRIKMLKHEIEDSKDRMIDEWAAVGKKDLGCADLL